jgi:hypothetical protein
VYHEAAFCNAKATADLYGDPSKAKVKGRCVPKYKKRVPYIKEDRQVSLVHGLSRSTVTAGQIQETMLSFFTYFRPKMAKKLAFLLKTKLNYANFRPIFCMKMVKIVPFGIFYPILV